MTTQIAQQPAYDNQRPQQARHFEHGSYGVNEETKHTVSQGGDHPNHSVRKSAAMLFALDAQQANPGATSAVSDLRFVIDLAGFPDRSEIYHRRMPLHQFLTHEPNPAPHHTTLLLSQPRKYLVLDISAEAIKDVKVSADHTVRLGRRL